MQKRTPKAVGVFVAVGASALLLAAACGGAYEVEPSVCDGRAKDACLAETACYLTGTPGTASERCLPPCSRDQTCGVGRVPMREWVPDYGRPWSNTVTDAISHVCVCVPESDFGRP